MLIGGNTLRSDNPRLLVNSEKRRADRIVAGKPEYPLKVTISASGDLGRDLKFWHFGDKKVVYTTDAAAPKLRETLDGLADVVITGPTVDLATRGVERLMVEGGGQIHTQFLSQGLADEIHLAIAPLLVGEAAAPRFLHPANYPGGSGHRMALLEARTIGDVVLLRYAPKPTSD
ncbi:RibD family protein [Kitasatospora sp. NPDC059648]|uniref:RibD family protein n=1 Tax=Kitasatospora sp. NPDC059648 TaxID=3346894 RepID=UPI0036D0AF51